MLARPARPMWKTDDMTDKEDVAKPSDDGQFDRCVQYHLSEIQKEDTPQRLLLLAQELQRLLRSAEK